MNGPVMFVIIEFDRLLTIYVGHRWFRPKLNLLIYGIACKTFVIHYKSFTIIIVKKKTCFFAEKIRREKLGIAEAWRRKSLQYQIR